MYSLVVLKIRNSKSVLLGQRQDWFLNLEIVSGESISLSFLVSRGCMHFLQRRQWQPTPVLLSGKSYGQRSLVDSSPWGHRELDMTEATQQQQQQHAFLGLQLPSSIFKADKVESLTFLSLVPSFSGYTQESSLL